MLVKTIQYKFYLSKLSNLFRQPKNTSNLARMRWYYNYYFNKWISNHILIWWSCSKHWTVKKYRHNTNEYKKKVTNVYKLLFFFSPFIQLTLFFFMSSFLYQVEIRHIQINNFMLHILLLEIKEKHDITQKCEFYNFWPMKLIFACSK